MTLLARMTIGIDNFPGAPGYNILHFSEGTAGGNAWAQTVVDDLYAEILQLCYDNAQFQRPGVLIQVSPELDIIESTTGQLQDVKGPTDLPVDVVGRGSGSDVPWAACALVKFSGDRIINGRRLNGRMYFGPLSGNALATDGSIASGAAAGISDNFDAVTQGLGVRLAVYHRPSSVAPSSGDWADVQSVTVRPTPSNLRRRAF